MTALRRHLIAVVAALFALAVGIALGGGPLSYVESDETGAEPGGETSVVADGPDTQQASTEGEDTGDGSAGAAVDGSGGGAFAEAFAAAAASRLYDDRMQGHPTAILTAPGVDPDVVEAMRAQVAAAGGGLTGVFEIEAGALDPDETSMVDTLTAQLMVQLGDSRIDPFAPTYARLGQLLSVALATPVRAGQRPSISSDTIRTSLGTAELLTAPDGARLAPVVLVLLPADDAAEAEEVAALTEVYSGLATGLRANAAGVVVVGDTASGDDGVLAGLRENPDVTGTLTTVDGGDTALGQVTAMLAVITALDGSVGAFGAAGSDGAVPLS